MYMSCLCYQDNERRMVAVQQTAVQLHFETTLHLFASRFKGQNQVEMLVVFVSANHRLDVLQLDISLGSVSCCCVLVVWLGLSIKPLGWGFEKIMLWLRGQFTCMNHFS